MELAFFTAKADHVGKEIALAPIADGIQKKQLPNIAKTKTVLQNFLLLRKVPQICYARRPKTDAQLCRETLGYSLGSLMSLSLGNILSF